MAQRPCSSSTNWDITSRQKQGILVPSNSSSRGSRSPFRGAMRLLCWAQSRPSTLTTTVNSIVVLHASAGNCAHFCTNAWFSVCLPPVAFSLFNYDYVYYYLLLCMFNLYNKSIPSVCLFVCLFVVNAKTTAQIDAKRSGITKNDPESVLHGLKSPILVLALLGDIMTFLVFHHVPQPFYLSLFYFQLLPRLLLTQSASPKRCRQHATSLLIVCR